YARVWEAEVMADRLCHVRSAAACLFNVMPPFTLPMIVRGALPAIRRDGPERLHLPWLLVFYAHLVDRFWGKLCASPSFQGKYDPSRPPPLARRMQPGDLHAFRWACEIGAIWIDPVASVWHSVFRVRDALGIANDLLTAPTPFDGPGGKL